MPTFPTPGPASQPPSTGCLQNDVCAFVYEKTGLAWLADTGYYALVKPARIVLIIVAALVLRFVAHRVIKRITRTAGAERGPGLLRPLRARMPSAECPPAKCVAFSNSSATWISAFEGMQPMLRQVPPGVCRLSMQAVFMPSCAARIAAT